MALSRGGRSYWNFFMGKLADRIGLNISLVLVFVTLALSAISPIILTSIMALTLSSLFLDHSLDRRR